MSKYYDAVYKSMHGKYYEPAKRNKDGMKYISHRFEIKNGISALDIMKKEFSKNNILYDMITNRVPG